MSRSKNLSLEDLKKVLRSADKRTQPRSASPSSKLVSSKKPPKPSAASPHTVEDEQQAFRQSVAGTRILQPNNRAELNFPLPAPLPRPRAKEPEEAKPVPLRHALNLPESWFNDEAHDALPHQPEARLLALALKGVTPIRTDKVFPELPKPRPEPVQHKLDEYAALEESIYAPTPLELRLEGGDELAYLRDNMPRSLLRDLRRGRWVVQDQLDLHGANRDEARELLAVFVGQCHKKDIRCIRVIHGKGLGSPGKEPILKKLVAGWLMNYDDVIAYTQAPVHDGGAGVLLVLLRAKRR